MKSNDRRCVCLASAAKTNKQTEKKMTLGGTARSWYHQNGARVYVYVNAALTFDN